jgi:hypothetical protein
MRNPWGSETYSGPWNDRDSRWTDSFKQQANLVVGDDGTFYMPHENFDTAFTSYTVLYYSDYKSVVQKALKGEGTNHLS